MNRARFASLALASLLMSYGHGCGDAPRKSGGYGPGGDYEVSVTTQPLVDPATIVVNTGTDVGTAPGNFSVGPDGSASYRMPLWTPESVSDATRATLALRYSSSVGEGRLGFGWDVEGLSEITRCRPGQLVNEPNAPIKFTNEDPLCLDGVRLSFISEDSGTSLPGTTGAVYYTLPDEQTRIRIVDADSFGPLKFEVRTPDGLIHSYGASAGGTSGAYAEGWRATWTADFASSTSPASATYAKVRYAWSLQRTEDRFGNAMFVDYAPRGTGICDASGETCVNVGTICGSQGAGGSCVAAGECTVSGSRCTNLGGACSGTQGTCEPRAQEPRPLPERITYGGGAGFLHRRSVSFQYVPRDAEAMRTTYVSGAKFQTRLRGSSIKMIAPDPADLSRYDIAFRSYQIDVHPLSSAKHQMVKSIQECDGDPANPGISCKKPTEFTYQSGSVQYTLLPVGPDPVDDIGVTQNTSTYRLRVADFNNDGRDDIAYRYGPIWKISLSKCQADLTGCGYDKGVEINIAPDLAGDPSLPRYDITMGDWDSDGYPDIFGIKPGEPGKYHLYRNQRGTGVPSFLEVTSFTENSDTLSSGILFANTAGKGHPYVMRPRQTPQDVRNLSRISTTLGGWDNAGMPWFASAMDTDWNFYTADVDGDGAADELMRRGTEYKRLSAQLLNRVGNVIQTTTLPISEPGAPRKYYFADLNGDGVSDAIQLTGGATSGVKTVENTGNGFRNAVALAAPAGYQITLNSNTTWMDLTDPGIRIYDHDGDGRDDILLVDDGRTRAVGLPNDPTRVYMVVLLSRNNGFEVQDLGIAVGDPTADGVVGRDIPAGSYHSNWLHTEILDANGDGRMDIANVQNGALRVFLNDSKPADKLTSVKDGMGYRTNATYLPLSNNTVYTPGTTCSYPQICIKRSLDWVVANHKSDNGIASDQTTTSLQYFDARTDAEVSMPLGFAKQKVTYPTHTVEAVADLNVRSDVALAGTGTPARALRVYPFTGAAMNSYETFTLPNGTRTRSILKSTEIKGSQYSKTCYVNIKETATYDYENGQLLRKITTSHPISAGWENYGVPTSQETKVYSEFLGNPILIERAYSGSGYYVLGGRAGWLWVPAWRSMVSEIPGNPSEVRVYDFDVNSTTGAVTNAYVEKSSTDNDIYLRTTYTRTARGKLATVVEQSRSGTTRYVATIQYDTLEGIYPTHVWNALNHHTTLVTHPGLGVLGEIVDPNGASTRFTYDRFGRQRSQQLPGGSGGSWSYAREYESGSSPTDERFVFAVTRALNGGGLSKQLINRLGQTIRRERRVSDPRNEYGSTPPNNYFTTFINSTYRDVGTLETVTRPTALGSQPAAATTYTWDNLGRLISTIVPDNAGAEAGGGTSTVSYNGLQETRTDPAGHETRITRNAAGRIIKQESKNDAGLWVPTTYEYRPFGLIRYVRRTPASGGTPITTQMTYDIRGRTRFLYDPDAHTRETRYNAFDDIRQSVNAKGEVTSYTRDALGREQTRSSPNETITSAWDLGLGGTGNLWSRVRGTVERVYYHDSFGRLIGSDLRRTNTSPSQVYWYDLEYSSSGQLSRIKYPYLGSSRIEARLNYDSNTGELISVDDPTGGSWGSWSLDRNSPDGQIERESVGNGAVTSRTYYAETGRLSNITTALAAANIQSLSYKYWAGGDLKSRSNLLSNVNAHERFDYDAMDRLKSWRWTNASGATNNTDWQVNYTIDDLGRLTRRQAKQSATLEQISDYAFAGTGNAGPHAVTSSSLYGAYQYDLNGNQTVRPGDGTVNETITYTDDDLPKIIAGPRAAEFEYDGSGARVEKRKPSTGDVVVYLDSLYEKRVSAAATEHVYYIPGPDGPFAEVKRKVVDGVVTSLPTRYLHRDYLGSVETVSCSAGDSACGATQTAEQSILYDPFGNRMVWGAANKYLPSSLGGTPNTYERFTGHEQDAEQSLINMKGRIFDPRTGRFLTPDPFVQSPFYGQNYDRYAYVLNNPLSYTDPSGYSWLGVVQRFFWGRSNQGAGPAPTGGSSDVAGGKYPQEWTDREAARRYTEALINWAISLSNPKPPAPVTGPNQPTPTPQPTPNPQPTPTVGPSRSRPSVGTGAGMAPPAAPPTAAPIPEAGTPGTGGGGTSRVGYGSTAARPSSQGANSGWDLIDSQRVAYPQLPGPDVLPDELLEWPYRLSPHVRRALQPIVDSHTRRLGVGRIDVSGVDIFIGTPDGRGRYVSPNAIRIPTPGIGEAGYRSTLGSILHEFGHVLQSRQMGHGSFLRTWRNQNESLGEDAYSTAGSLEWDANAFRSRVLQSIKF
jgi:RHS repeat-associated protein